MNSFRNALLALANVCILSFGLHGVSVAYTTTTTQGGCPPGSTQGAWSVTTTVDGNGKIVSVTNIDCSGKVTQTNYSAGKGGGTDTTTMVIGIVSQSDSTFFSTSGVGQAWEIDGYLAGASVWQVISDSLGNDSIHFGSPARKPVSNGIIQQESTIILGPTGQPINGQIQVNLTLDRSEPVSIELCDILGHTLTAFSGSQSLPAGQNTLNFSISNLPNGTYFLRVEASGIVQTQKLRIEN